MKTHLQNKSLQAQQQQKKLHTTTPTEDLIGYLD